MRHQICCGIKSHDMERVCIYPKDVAKLMGISLRQAQRVLKKIRFSLNKKEHQFITVKEFANYLDIDESVIHLK